MLLGRSAAEEKDSQIHVTVVGEVEKPGYYSFSGASKLASLHEKAGVSDFTDLRRITIIRISHNYGSGEIPSTISKEFIDVQVTKDTTFSQLPLKRSGDIIYIHPQRVVGR